MPDRDESTSWSRSLDRDDEHNPERFEPVTVAPADDWEYRASPNRGVQRRYRSEVQLVSGHEAEQLRGRLARVTHELLSWATTQQQIRQPPDA